MTIAISIKQFHEKTDEILDAVVKREETVIVSLADGRTFALVPSIEYESLDETTYLTSTTANRTALEQSLCEANAGRTTTRVDL